MKAILYKDLSYEIIGAAMEVHQILGDGFLESVYENALAYEFENRGILYDRQVHLPVSYKGITIGNYIADFIIEKKIILELKALTKLTDVHKAQTINYLSATELKLAILLNFGSPSLMYQRIMSKRNSRNS